MSDYIVVAFSFAGISLALAIVAIAMLSPFLLFAWLLGLAL